MSSKINSQSINRVKCFENPRNFDPREYQCTPPLKGAVNNSAGNAR